METTSYALLAFYIIAFSRWILISIRSSRLREKGEAVGDPVWPAEVAVLSLVVSTILAVLLSSAVLVGTLVMVLGPWIFSKLLLTIFIVLLLFPHFLIAVEYRSRVVDTIWKVVEKYIMVFVAVASLPAAMFTVTFAILISIGYSSQGTAETNLDSLFVGANSLPTNSDARAVFLYWINQSIQSPLFDIPETFGFKLGYLEHNPKDSYFSALVVVYKILVSLLSAYLVFGTYFNRVVSGWLKLKDSRSINKTVT